ncbi:MAG: hypothetical protein GY733_08720 [bacterium]|nr:hypothetical protein [bacterium]
MLSLVVGAQVAVPEATAFRATGDEPIEIRAVWGEGGTLRVVSVDGGDDLSGVDILTGKRFGHRSVGAGFEYPPIEYLGDPEHRVLLGGTSPLRLPDMPEANTFWIRAKGHAWKRVSLEAGAGERLVALEPSGTLRVLVDMQGLNPERTSVFLYSDSDLSETITQRPLEAAGLMVFDSMPPTHGVATLELYEGGRRKVLCRAPFETMAGTTTDVELVDSYDRRAESSIKVVATLADPLNGALTLVLHSSENAARPVKLSRRMEDLDSGLTFRASHKGLAPGNYIVELRPLGFSRSVELPAGTESSFQFAVPAFTHLKVWLVRADNGEPVSEGSVSLAYMEDGKHLPYRSLSPLAPGCWSSMVAPSKSRLRCAAHGYRIEHRELDLISGPSDLVIEMTPQELLPLEITLKDGDALVPAAWAFWCDVRAVQEGGRGVGERITSTRSGSTSDTASAVTSVTEAGTYRVTFQRTLPGYEPIPVASVVVGGAGAKLEIKLQRSRPTVR